ncbi:hypothetical protein C2E23DRAFT_863507 [Lenzites betulinus]|nr:hypothetical protein C2E23DRAFT_863507 [Lenzites betulinus]
MAMAFILATAQGAYLDNVFIAPAERATLAADERRFTRWDSLKAGINEPAARFTNFTNALQHANESAKLGLVSPAVLTAGFLLRDFGKAAGIDLLQMTRSALFGPLWKTVTRRLDELYAEERIKQTKIARNPAACPPDLKPHYCSPECQKKQDWPRHKAVCKPGSKGRLPGTSDQPKAVATIVFLVQANKLLITSKLGRVLVESKLVVLAVANKMDLPERVMSGRVRRAQPSRTPQLEQIVHVRGSAARHFAGTPGSRQGSRSI